MMKLQVKARKLADRIRRLASGQFVILTLVAVAVVVPLGKRARTGRAELVASQAYVDSILISSRAGADSIDAQARIRRGIVQSDSEFQANLTKTLFESVARANSELTAVRNEETVDALYGLVAFLIVAAWVATAWIWFGRKSVSP